MKFTLDMLNDQYSYFSAPDFLSYEFLSSGKNGDIRKIVQYSKTRISGTDVYNLGFGDLIDGRINDTAVSDNGDMNTVLATVASTVYDFTNHHGDQWIFARGSNKIRTRLYQRKLRQNLEYIHIDFEVYGLNDEGWERFNKTDDYSAFLIKRK